MGSSTTSARVARDSWLFKNTMLPAPTHVCVEHCMNASLAAVKETISLFELLRIVRPKQVACCRVLDICIEFNIVCLLKMSSYVSFRLRRLACFWSRSDSE